MKPEDDRKRNPSQMEPASSPETNCPKRRTVAATPTLPSDAPEWAKVMFDSLHKKFGDLELDIGNSIEFVTGLVRDTDDKAEANSVKIQEISEKLSHANCEIGALKQENRFLKEKIVNLEAYSRRENLLFNGINESRDETSRDCATQVYSVLEKIDSQFKDINILKCHRKGKYIRGQKIPIIAKFLINDRDLIWDKKSNLKGTPFFVSEDFPYEIEQNRRLLLPVYLQARKSAAWKEKVKLKGDKLIVEDVVYTVETINKLPTGLNPAHQSTRENDRVMVFHGAASPFSNSFPCSFKENGVIFNNVEQYTLYHKAIAVKDDVTATRILGLNNISEQRRCGKSIPSFPLWRGLHREKTETGNILKFSQNTSLAQTLKNTGNKKIGEANGFDTIYGIGVRLTDPNTLNDNDWTGENVMGQILMRIRQDIAKSWGAKMLLHLFLYYSWCPVSFCHT